MNKKIRILHVGIDSHLGGIESYLKKITTNIDREKFQFDFLTYEGTVPCYYKELKNMGCRFYFIHSRRKNPIKNIIDLNRLFKNNKFDIVHCHFNSLSYIAPCIIALKYNNKVIIHSRNAGCLKSLKTKILHKINYYRILKLNITRVAVSDLAGTWMFGKKKFLVLNNGVDIEKYKFSYSSRKKIRREMKIGENQEVIMHVGAFRKQKNHEFIIQVFREYNKLHSNSILLLVGEGELKTRILELTQKFNIEKNCIFMGNRKDINEILSAADKFIFPSLYEGFPNALLEAETSGLLCVVSDTITKQVLLQNIAYKLSLKAPIEEWVSKLEKEKIKDRENCTKKIEENKLGVYDEIKRLEGLYYNIFDMK